MALTPQPLSRFNLTETSILLVQSSTTEGDIYAQMLAGFGAKHMQRVETLAAAWALLSTERFDLILTDAKLSDGDGYEFVRGLRRGPRNANTFAPILMLAGHTPRARVELARDCGAHFVISKPVSPAVLLERILWIARETRPFVECEVYVGPERRFKFEGPPDGVGRRMNDLNGELGESQEPNLEQSEVDQMLQPQKVMS